MSHQVRCRSLKEQHSFFVPLELRQDPSGAGGSKPGVGGSAGGGKGGGLSGAGASSSLLGALAGGGGAAALEGLEVERLPWLALGLAFGFGARFALALALAALLAGQDGLCFLYCTALSATQPQRGHVSLPSAAWASFSAGPP